MPRRRIYATSAERQAAYRHRRESLAGASQLAQAAVPPVPATSSMPSHKRWRGLLKHATLFVDQAAHEMQSYFEGRSELWQSSERGEAFAEILDAVQDVLAALGDVPY
jgi:hypothetical protein